jgi:hypothetical protein
VFTSLSEGLFSVLQVPLEMSRQFERRKNKKIPTTIPDAGQWPELMRFEMSELLIGELS